MAEPTSPNSPARTVHLPVLLREVIAQLQLSPGIIVADGTVGAGGHSAEIWKRIQPGGTLIACDRDSMMLQLAKQKLPAEGVHWHHGSYSELQQVLATLSLDGVDRLLVDLGFSSDQLEDASRGFSFQSEGPLDLRFDTRSGEPASAWLANVTATDLESVLREYGEEPHARKLAAFLVEARTRTRIATARDLAEVVASCLGGDSSKHPATRTFQALRIVVNRELDHVQTLLNEIAPQCVRLGGRFAVISFHSLEDRLVKTAFKNKHIWTAVTEKPVVATPAEVRFNPRSRSAKLRVAQRSA